MATKAQAAGLEIIDPTTIEDLGGNRQKARKVGKQNRLLPIRDPPHGYGRRYLGIVLGPRGKMPRPCAPEPRPGDDGCWPQRHDHCEVESCRMTFHAAFGTKDQTLRNRRETH